jgi:hypothetical protein
MPIVHKYVVSPTRVHLVNDLRLKVIEIGTLLYR